MRTVLLSCFFASFKVSVLLCGVTFASLNVSAATAILLYEVVRQRT
jgi:tRNA G18 (ribose-2'-O)-methylase SpoU